MGHIKIVFGFKTLFLLFGRSKLGTLGPVPIEFLKKSKLEGYDSLHLKLNLRQTLI